MRIAIELSASRLTFSSSLMHGLLIACIVGCSGCNAMIDFGFEFGSDGGQTDAGPRDSGAPPAQDAGDAAVDGGDRDASACPSQSEDCTNDEDDDCDGMEDCGDPDCAATTDCCRPNQIPEVSCSGGIDNDCDQAIDCDDSDCAVSPLCCTASGPEVGVTNCDDSTDNDCDGLLDCQELSCRAQPQCCDATGDENDEAVCDDNIDNDCDGNKDCADPECFETSTCCTGSTSTPEDCTDNNDNDCDGLYDCEDDDCTAHSMCADCVASSTTERSCMDDVDDDCDLKRDCRDADCYDTPQCCLARGSRPERDVIGCTDGADNDCDGLTDCGDPDCSGQQFCCVGSPENTDETCRDTLDNDCDGLLNCGDDSCYGTTECCDETGSEDTNDACSDTSDNDCDGKLNCSDPDCAGTTACCTAASGETAGLGACCVPDGMSEAAAPNDGRDNDCDGSVDRPVLKSAFPIDGLPTSGLEVSLEFMTEIDRTAQLQCRTRRLGASEPRDFTACPMSGVFVNPFTDQASANADNNGLWETQVLWKFGNGATSEVHTFKYYVHNTLHKVEHCPNSHTPQQWFATAATRLGSKSPGTFNLGVDTFLASPFIRVQYQVPKSTWSQYYLNGESPKIDMWSLRRRFTLSVDSLYLLITRNYRATRTGSCAAAGISVHNFKRGGSQNSAYHRYGCDAIALNRAGVGVCMNAGKPAPVFPPNTDTNDRYVNMLGWDKANKFMWRNILEPGNGGLINFTTKCKATPCPGGIYLPDSQHFRQ